MEKYELLKSKLGRLTMEVESLIDAVERLPGITLQSAANWRQTCSAITQQISEDRIRVAIVGPIKSGKSTFTNALLKGDYLKRGAGVVTSIVTRITHGDHLQAQLYFKSWEEINDDIEHALVLFPNRDWLHREKSFDLRRESDRDGLAEALQSLKPDQLITNDTRDANSVLLLSYLKGYDQVAELIGDETAVVRYDDGRFHEHRGFVGDDALAVFLKDVELSVPMDSLGRNVELADCQGSDSPNPLHLAMIQDYLLTTHLIVYVISSRTGLRRADIDFLSVIRKMGISNHLLFILNVDFGEHDSREDLEILMAKVREELSLLVSEPEIFPFSALFRLLGHQRDRLSEKDRLRIEQWEQEPPLIELSDAGLREFTDTFHGKVVEDACGLLLWNPAERLHRIASGIGQLAAVKRQMITVDTDKAREILERVRHHLEQMKQVCDIIRSTLSGGQDQIRKELRLDIERFFDDRTGRVTASVIEFVRNYTISSPGEYEHSLKNAGFPATLYRVYQEFRQTLESHMAEIVNPEIVSFVRGREERIAEHLHTLVAPYRTLVRDAVTGVNRTFADIGVDSHLTEDVLSEARLDMERIRRESKLNLPPAKAVMRYSAKVKTEAVFRLGIYRFLRGVKKMLRKPLNSTLSEERQALDDGVRRMKRETEAALRFHCKDLRENIKFRYVFKMLEAGSDHMAEILLGRIEMYASDLGQMVEGVEGDKSEMAQQADRLKEICIEAEQLVGRLQSLRENICRVN